MKRLMFVMLIVVGNLSLFGETATNPGDAWDSIIVSGRTRSFLIHVPPNGSIDSPRPLMLFLHGGRGPGARLMEQRSGMNQTADTNKFIVVYPESSGSQGKVGWEGHVNTGTEDTVFLQSLIAYIQTKWNTDPKRVYLLGFSAGALMAYKAGALNPESYAALGSVCGSFAWDVPSGELPPPLPDLTQPISVISFNGKIDPNVPYEGFQNDHAACWPIEKTISWWVKQDNCTSHPKTDSSVSNQVLRREFTSPEGTKVVSYILNQGKHGWNGAGQKLEFDMNQVIWDFFVSVPLR